VRYFEIIINFNSQIPQPISRGLMGLQKGLNVWVKIEMIINWKQEANVELSHSRDNRERYGRKASK
jgi:hypothetical protein